MEQKGKTKFIRVKGRVVPLRDSSKIKSGEYKGVTRGRKKQITKELAAERGHFAKRNKIIKKKQNFGVTVGMATGIGAAVALRKGTSGILKGGALGVAIGLVGGTLAGKSAADKKVGTIQDFNKKRKSNTGF